MQQGAVRGDQSPCGGRGALAVAGVGEADAPSTMPYPGASFRGEASASNGGEC